MEDLKNEIISKIRSCLISTKGQITLKQLEDDYRTLLGERIPYTKLGYKNLESLITSIPSIMTWRSSNGEVLVDARVSEKSAHISNMVQKQKSMPVKKKLRIPPKSNRTYSQPPTVPTKWRPKTNPAMKFSQKPYECSPRLAAVSHSQFVRGQKREAQSDAPSTPKFRHDASRKENLRPESSGDTWKENLRPEAPGEPWKENLRPEASGDKWGEEEEEVCSPLSSTMKRISRIMSEISVERDSGNSSPTAEFALNYKLSGEPVSDLRTLAAYHKLGEVDVKFTDTKAKNSKVKQWHCKITVGQHKYSSYPADFTDMAAAEKHASQKALDDLMQRHSRRKSLLVSSNDDVIERIPPMLEKHNNAVWCWQIEADYIDKYNEQLPSDWLRVIDNSAHVSLEKCCGGYVLKHCKPDDKGRAFNVSLNVGDVSVPCSSVHFDANNRLYALVTAAHSANEIWCQDCETRKYGRFMEMMSKVEKFYGEHRGETLTKRINAGSWYVIHHDGGYLRVRALSAPQDGFVDCFLIDYGDQVATSVDNVHVLKREFAVLEAQAFVCRLAGLEKLYEASADSEHLSAIVGKEFVLENVVDETGVSDDVTIPVVMYDVNTFLSLNEELITLLTIESATPALNKNSFTEVHVSNIESNGEVYVQIRNQSFDALMEMMNQLEAEINGRMAVSNVQCRISAHNSADKLYLIKCDKTTSQWRRVKILEWCPTVADLAQIYYVDYGNTEVVHVDKATMFPLSKLDDIVDRYPPQAIKVRVMIDKIPVDFVRRAEKLMPEEELVFLKIMSYDNEGVAWVELYKRTADGVLVFINKNISVEAEFQNFDDHSGTSGAVDLNPRKRLFNMAHNPDASKNVPSGGSLKKPILPDIGSYFNVNVPFAVNPWNFCVQPLDSMDELTALMTEMQTHYKNLQHSPMQIDDVVPGQIYASRHEDGCWYRTSVLKVIHSGSISIFYCDFGYYTNLTIDQLVPLEAKFMSFPYQALKAKIAGIRPIKNKWTMEDCDMFRTLVTKKQFVSVLVDIERDEFNKNDIILQLLLIDTSSDKDVFVKELLIERGIATNV